MSGASEETTTRSGRQYKTKSSQRRISVPGIPVAPAATGQTRTTMSSDPVTQALVKINESLESLTKQGAENSRKLTELSIKLDQNTQSVNELGKRVTSNTESINKILEDSANIRKIAEEAKVSADEAKVSADATQEKIVPVCKKLEDHTLALSMLELERRSRNLRLRAVPESEGDNLANFLSKEFSDFWQQELEKEEIKIVTAFRLGRAQGRKKPRDCLITLRSREEREKILSLHFQRTLEIEKSFVEIFKDIPKEILDARTYYKELVGLLKKNEVPFRWEFPQGLSFKFKGRKIRIRSVEDRDQFLNHYREDLLKGTVGEEITSETKDATDILNLTFGLKSPTEEEQLLGATGGK